MKFSEIDAARIEAFHRSFKGKADLIASHHSRKVFIPIEELNLGLSPAQPGCSRSLFERETGTPT